MSSPWMKPRGFPRQFSFKFRVCVILKFVISKNQAGENDMKISYYYFT